MQNTTKKTTSQQPSTFFIPLSESVLLRWAAIALILPHLSAFGITDEMRFFIFFFLEIFGTCGVSLFSLAMDVDAERKL